MSEEPRIDREITRGKPFEPGNPGKPRGARNRATRALEALLGQNAEEVARAVIRAVKRGDTRAARLVLERVLPPRKDNAIALELPSMTDATGLKAAGEAVLAAMASGEITPSEADTVFSLIERQRRIVETVDLEARIAALEGGHNG